MNLAILFDNLRKRGIRLWSEGDKLKAFLPKDVKLEPVEKELIDAKKDEIIAILKRNRIFTAEDSEAREILEGLNEGGAWELSFAQERLWFIEQLEGGSSAYNIPMVYDLGDGADLDAFRKSVQDIAMRHEVLRTVFRRDDEGSDFQTVLPSAPPIEEERITEAELSEKLKSSLTRVFDLVGEGPLKAGIFITEKSAYSVIVVHHIAFDGWSAEIFERELEALYLHHREGKEALLPRLDIQYRDYALWQRARLAGQELERQKSFWKNTLRGCEKLEFPTDRARPARVDYQGGNVHFELSAELSGKLTGMAGSMGVTLYTVLLSTLYVLLNKYTGQSSLVVGTSAANREHRELENMIGFFVNSMALKADIAPAMTFSSLVEAVHRLLMESQQYRELPFEKVVEALEVEKDLSMHPVFQVMFGLQCFGSDKEKLFCPVPLDDCYEPAKFDLSLFIDGQGTVLRGMFNYAVSLFDRETIERMKGHYLKVLDQVTLSPDIPIRSITIVTGSELDQLNRWNETDDSYNRDSTIVSLFEEQVEKTPNLTAVICRREKLTYRELNWRANQLAHIIRRDYRDFTGSDVKGDTLIGVYIERSIDMIIAVLGVLKAGAAYVPFDSADPTERLRFKINNCGCRIVLTRSESVKDLVFLIETDTVPLSLDTYADELCRAPVGNPAHINSPTDLAYIIYTSGSTGRPKGVMLEHRSVLNYVENYRSFTSPGHKIFDLSSSLSFDLTVTTTLAPLLTGSTIAIYSGSLKDMDEYARYIDRYGVSFIKTVPSLLYLLLGHSRHTSLREIFVGGEKLNRDLLNHTEGLTIYDEYGPTEATVGTTLSIVAPLCQPGIGKPYHNYRIYILDGTGAPVPIGVTGEIYIGGEGLARGYLKRPELTAERFVDNPFATAGEIAEGRNLRMYRTGDLARWKPDGNIEYIGRNDDQIKIRGFRVELGEIEERLSEHRSVTQCSVLCRELNGNRYLAAYYVAREQISADSLRAHLAALLPEYMIPSFFTQLEEMPLTVNGKVDRNVLPEPDMKGDDHRYIAPRNDVEDMLCRIWAAELGIEKIGITENFFSMGGNSILAIKLSHRMAKALEREIPVASIFELKTVKNVAEEMARFRRQVNIEPCGSDEAVLSFAQERLYFIEEYEGGSSAYNIPLLYELDGETDIDALKKAIESLVMRQEILRTVFVRKDSGEVRQKVCADPPYIREREISESDFEMSVAEDINAVFDLHNEYPFRAVFYRAENKRRILFIIHHIAFDGWSADIFLSELEQFYRHYRDGSAVTLARLEIQYRDFAVWQRAYLSGERLEGELEYWRKALADYRPFEFPADLPRPKEVQYGGDYHTFELDSELSEKLRAAVSEYGTTPYSLFLAAFYILLYRYSGQDDIIIGTPTANRQYRQLEDLVGFFVNSTVMRCIITPGLDIRGLIEHTAAAQAAVQMHQDMPFEKLTELLHVEKDPSRHPLFQILFSVQSFGDSDLTGKLRFMKPLDCSGLYKVSKFDLSLFISDSGKTFTGGFNYATSLFEKARIAQLSRHYQNILRQMASGDNSLIKDMPLLSSAERDMIIRDWNETGASYPRESTIAEIFEAQAERDPDGEAVLFDNESLTYRELNERANRLAHTLRRDYRELTGTEIKGDTLIGIYMERSLDMIVAILGILKSGAAYVPFDRVDPQARLKFKINDSGARMIITSSRCIGDLVFLTENDALPLSIDEYRDELEKAPCTNPGRVSSSRDLAYVIYTSGSTGIPKGVMIEQYGVVNLAFSHRKSLEITGDSRILHFAPQSFDASISTLFCALQNGATLCMCTEEMRNDAAKLSAFISGSKISHIDIPAKLLEILPKDLDCTSLRSIITAGEICDSRTMEYWGGRVKLINAYGPTESTVCATFAAYAPGRSNVNIGKPISNKKVYVLDSNLSPVPAGVPGELYIGGDGLARCYLNQPDMTAARFVKNPFLHESEQTAERRMYRTGDVARWTRDGDLEFLGRNDDQVKIRGYRIELAEVEHELSACPGIVMCAVTVCQQDHNRHLCAYYTVSRETSADEIRAYLATLLPDYMIPSFYMELEAFPLSASGKVDRKALPEPRAEAGRSLYVPPADELQQKICEIFSGLLGIEKTGINDDFFKLGGDSIMSIQLSSSLRNAGLECAVKDIFKNPTVLKLSEHIAAHREQKVPVIAEQGVLEGEFDLLPIQRWFFEHVATGQFEACNHWNQSFTVKVPELDTDLLARCIQSLALHHDMLRAAFSADRQHYRREIAVPELKILDRSGISDDGLLDVLTGWQSGFDIERGPLWQIGYVRGFEDGSARLFFALHHLIADAVSWRILIEDMRRLYGREQLKEKTSSYRQWVNAVKHYPEQHPDERHYWEATVRALPDYSPHRDEGAKPVKRELRLSRELTGQLLREANRAYLTQVNDLLLTAFAFALKDWHGGDAQGVTVEGHGREDIDPSIDHSHTLGWFTTVCPVRFTVPDDPGRAIVSIKQALRQIPRKGIGWGAFCCSSHREGPGRLCNNLRLPPVTFNYLGQLDGGEASGLWQFVNEPSGVSIDPSNPDLSLIAVNGIASNGQMVFSVVTRLDEEATDRLVRRFEESLQQITSHCQEVNRKGGLPGYNVEDFEYIPAMLLNKNGRSKRLAIIIHPDSGYEAYMATLYPALSSDIRVILVDNFYKKVYLRDGVVMEKYHFSEFSGLADYYVKLLLEEHGELIRESKCFLIGYSFGSPIAIEMDRLFRERGMPMSSLYLIDPLIPHLLRTRRELDCFEWYRDYVPACTATPVIHFRCTEPDPELPGYTEYFINPRESSLSPIAENLEEINIRCRHTAILTDPGFLKAFGEKANRELVLPSGERQVSEQAAELSVESSIRDIVRTAVEMDDRADIDGGTNLFQLGCTSIQCLSLLGMVNERFRLELALSDVIGSFTVKGIAAMVAKTEKAGYDEERWKPVEFASPHLQADTLYFFPGLIGSVGSYSRICRRLSDSFRVVFLEPKGMYGTMVPFAGYEEAIHAYADEIAARSGPGARVFLAGHSIGSIHSIDTALILEERSFTDIRLINIDGYLHGIMDIKESLHTDNLDEALLSAVRIFFERGHDLEHPGESSSGDPLQQIASTLFPQGRVSRDHALRVALGYRNIWHQQLSEMLNYREPSGKFGGLSLLFLTGESGEEARENIVQSCRSRCLREPKAVGIAGDHLSCITRHDIIEEICTSISEWVESDSAIQV